jgi:hypothetical protein
MTREIFFNDRLAFDAPVGARAARVCASRKPSRLNHRSRPRGRAARERACLIGSCSIPLFDIVNVDNRPAASRSVSRPFVHLVGWAKRSEGVADASRRRSST